MWRAIDQLVILFRIRKFLNNGRTYTKVVSKEAEKQAEEDKTLRECLKWIGQVGMSLKAQKLRCVPRSLGKSMTHSCVPRSYGESGLVWVEKKYKKSTFFVNFPFYSFIFTTMSTPSILDLAPIVSSAKATADFLMEKNILYNRSTGLGVFICPTCATQMTLINRARNVYIWQCPSYSCEARKTRSFRAGSFFFNVKIPLNSALLVLYLWVTKVSMGQFSTFSGVSPNTVRELVRNLYYALEESLPDEYLEVGKFVVN
jgi:hypothetical protein